MANHNITSELFNFINEITGKTLPKGVQYLRLELTMDEPPVITIEFHPETTLPYLNTKQYKLVDLDEE